MNTKAIQIGHDKWGCNKRVLLKRCEINANVVKEILNISHVTLTNDEDRETLKNYVIE